MIKKFEVQIKDGKYLPDKFYSHLWTPEQEKSRGDARAFPEDCFEYLCRRHPDFPLVLTLDPGALYCALCMTSIPYSKLDKEKGKVK